MRLHGAHSPDTSSSVGPMRKRRPFKAMRFIPFLGQLLAGPMRAGKLVWIGLRPSPNMPMLTPNSAVLISGRGIEGDHYDTRQNGPRQATLNPANAKVVVVRVASNSSASPKPIDPANAETAIRLSQPSEMNEFWPDPFNVRAAVGTENPCISFLLNTWRKKI